MSIQIIGASTEGDGGVKQVLVTPKGRLNTIATTRSDTLTAATNENAYSLNTGVIGSLTTANSAIFYYKHNENQKLIVDEMVFGIDDADESGRQQLKIIKNPTTGTIVSGASAGDINSNRNFDSGRGLDNSTFYKGANGNTFTDGSDFGFFYASDAARSSIPLEMVLERGNSIGVTVSPQLNTGSLSMYVAMICHLEDF